MLCKRRSVTLLLERGSTVTAKFLRTLILKNICERLLVKISISVTNSEAVPQKSSVKKVFLEILQNSQQNTCARASYRCFPVNFVKFLRPTFFIEHLLWLHVQIYRREVIPEFY